MDGLKCLLAEVEQESDVITESDPNGDALFSALQDLVSNRPKNLLQELKGLVAVFRADWPHPRLSRQKRGFPRVRMQPCQIRPRELARRNEIQRTLSPGLCKQRAKARARAKVLALLRSPFLRLMNPRRPLESR